MFERIKPSPIVSAQTMDIFMGRLSNRNRKFVDAVLRYQFRIPFRRSIRNKKKIEFLLLIWRLLRASTSHRCTEQKRIQITHSRDRRDPPNRIISRSLANHSISAERSESNGRSVDVTQPWLPNGNDHGPYHESYERARVRRATSKASTKIDYSVQFARNFRRMVVPAAAFFLSTQFDSNRSRN